jgi:alpha-beta hydrolase superfamily lysophospholipase
VRALKRIGIPLALLAGGALGAWLALPRLAAMAFIVRAAKTPGLPGRLARRFTREVAPEPLLGLPTRHGPMPAQLFRPAGRVHRTAILLPGLHKDGIHEERLSRLAGELAASGLQVLTIAPPDLARYRITTATTDQIEDAITWAAQRRELAPDGRVAVMGVSFAGGLALVAAGRTPVRARVAYALSFGGHGDLLRVLRYLCTGNATELTPELRALATGGAHIHVPKPHDYGAVVALLNLADRILPAEQVAPLAEAITVFLEASSIDRLDHDGARAHFARARELGDKLPEPARRLMGYVNDRNVQGLGQALAPLLASLDLPPELSPERSPPPSAPVFLLHGADDAVVPASEMLLLARGLRGATSVRAFASRLITHAEANRGAALAEMWRLAGFWQPMLSR